MGNQPDIARLIMDAGSPGTPIAVRCYRPAGFMDCRKADAVTRDPAVLFATARADKRPSRFYYAEWIALHTDPGFRDFVEWMRAELDRIGPDLREDRRDSLAVLFCLACELEMGFFNAAYEPG